MATMESINAKANAGLATGITGATLGAIASGVLGGNGNGILGNLFGGAPSQSAAADMLTGMVIAGAMNRPYACESDHGVNRYEAAQAARIAELETEVKFRDANIYTDSKIAEVYERLNAKYDAKIGCLEAQLCDQKVYNATNTAVLGCIQNQVAQLMGLTKIVVPNSSIYPGWGNVTVTPEAATAPAA